MGYHEKMEGRSNTVESIPIACNCTYCITTANGTGGGGGSSSSGTVIILTPYYL